MKNRSPKEKISTDSNWETANALGAQFDQLSPQNSPTTPEIIPSVINDCENDPLQTNLPFGGGLTFSRLESAAPSTHKNIDPASINQTKTAITDQNKTKTTENATEVSLGNSPLQFPGSTFGKLDRESVDDITVSPKEDTTPVDSSSLPPTISISSASALKDFPLTGDQDKKNLVEDPFRTKDDFAPKKTHSLDVSVAGLVQLPGYEILKELGRGGMGVVYKARHLSLNRIVAIKMLLTGSHAGHIGKKRFLQEAEAVARLEHPNIVQIFEIGEAEGLPFFTLEFLSGGCLADIIKSQPLNPFEAASITRQVAQGMAYAHKKGIVHRDIKPANILLKEETTPGSKSGSFAPQYSIKITDFGLAKKIESSGELTGSHNIMGTPSYMAPEQARGKTKEIGPQADIYAIGALLYHLITGRPPFQAARPMDIIYKVLENDPIPPRKLEPKIDRDLEIICLKCLEKEPIKRYDSCDSLADDIQRYMEGKPIQARPPSFTESIFKFARRKPASAGLIASCFLGGIALLGLVFFYIQLKNEEGNRLKTDLEKSTRIRSLFSEASAYENLKDFDRANSALEKAVELLGANSEFADLTLINEIKSKKTEIGNVIDESKKKQVLRKNYNDFKNAFDKCFFSYIQESLGNNKNFDVTIGEINEALNFYSELNRDSFLNFWENQKKHLKNEEFNDLKASFIDLLVLKTAILKPGESEKEKESGLLDLFKENFNMKSFILEEIKKDDNVLKNLKNFEFEKQVENLLYIDKIYFCIYFIKNYKLLECIKICDNIVTNGSGQYWVHYIKAMAMYLSKDYLGSKAQFTICIGQKPDFPWAYVYRAKAETELGAIYMKNITRANEEFSLAFKDFEIVERTQDPLLSFAIYSNRGILYFRQKDYQKALADFSSAKNIYLKNNKIKAPVYDNFNNASQAYIKINQPKKALEELAEGLDLFPGNSFLFAKRGLIYNSLNRLELAEKDFQSAKKIDPGLVFGRFENSDKEESNLDLELGKLALKQDRFVEALKFLEVSLANSPSISVAERLRADALFKIKNFREAGASLDKYLEKALQKTTITSEDYEFRGLLHELCGEGVKSIHMYTNALNYQNLTKSKMIHLLSLRGWASYSLKAYEIAKSDFENVYNLDNYNLDGLNGAAICLLKIRDFKNATKFISLVDTFLKSSQVKLSKKDAFRVAILYSLAAEVFSSDPGILEETRKTKNEIEKFKSKSIAHLKLFILMFPKSERLSICNKIILKENSFKIILNESFLLQLENLCEQN